MSSVGETTAPAHAAAEMGDPSGEFVEEEDSAEMDAKVAAIMHLQQVQQKQEVMQLMEAHPVTNADTEFRVQLEELVRDHLNTCMALASHGSRPTSPTFSLRNDSSDSRLHLLDRSGAEHCHHHHHHHHRYHLVVANGEDQDPESERTSQHSGENVEAQSDSNLPQRIADRWDERQQGDRETTVVERQVREAELLALSSLHAVSTLDASFLQGSPSPRAENSVDRPQRLSPLVQMWRDLEGELQDREIAQTVDKTRMRGVETREAGSSWRECGADSEIARGTVDCNEDGLGRAAAEDSRQDCVLAEGEGSGVESPRAIQAEEVEELVGNSFVQVPSSSNVDVGAQNEMSDGARERVPQIARRLMQENGVAVPEESETVQPSGRINDDLWNERDRERVRRMVREWVRGSSFESDSPSAQRGSVRQRRENDEEATESRGSSGASVLSVRNRFGWDDDRREQERAAELLTRSELERQRELEGISEHRTVSEFAHRSRLQSFLRGRFLRSAASSDADRPPSVAAGEIGQLRQRRAVSGLREGFRFRLETIVRSQSGSGLNELQRRQQENPSIPPQPQHTHTERRPQRERPSLRLDTFDDATAYNMELRELLARQSVTNMLASDFRDRLDQLIRSFIQAQGRTPQPWNITRARRPAPVPAHQQGQDRQQQEQNPFQAQRRWRNGAAGPSVVSPGGVPLPPPRPAHPLWEEEQGANVMQREAPHAPAWPRQSQQRSPEMEWEKTSQVLRADLNVLQQGMTELREMLEVSIQMQDELKRSVRQEISGALQRMYVGKALPDEALDGSKWALVKKGVCCICCEKQIDSLLYRCGHMCTCVKCANELHSNSGTCPMCRAAIVEVVRAFTVA